ncbi:MAG TPA: autotransporter-associated beta strand repeat-containing protein, partial [Thermomicrobiales bacterium]|nr:autotransporter-associated beta strand repeat-containing protein [Thermomicrobiales bacterium]
VALAGLSGATATIVGSGSGTQASIDLGGGTRNLSVADAAAAIDLAANVPIKNGALTKSGLGTMSLGAVNTLSGATTITDGILQVTANNQLGSSVVTSETVTTPAVAGHGGTLQLTGNVSYDLPMTIGGAGVNGISITPPGIAGALDSASGANTWAGNITLIGGGTNGSDPTINQISAAAGSTLVLSGVIQDGGVSASLAKSGGGDVVLSGSSPNTYSNLTRVYGGRLIIEKDGALGSAGSTTGASGNTFQLANSNSVIAFRAPPASAGFRYGTFEWINLDGNGAGSLGQLDNLGGNNTFAGNIGLAGPTIDGNINAYLGVSAGSLELAGGIYARGTTGQRILNKLGAGTLIISGDSAPVSENMLNVALTDSTFNINAGAVELRGPAATTTNLPGVTTWNVNAGAALNSSSGMFITGAVNVNSGGVYNFIGGATNIASLNVNDGAVNVLPGGKTLRVNSIDISGGGKINLSNNRMIVDYAGASPSGSWNGS